MRGEARGLEIFTTEVGMTKTVLITGASSGFGAGIARRFAEAGCSLVLAARRAEKLAEVAAELASVPVHSVVLDVRDRGAVFEALSNLPEAFRNIDVLVNNAGLALGLEPAHQADLDDWEVMVDTNIKGLMYVTRCLLPGMVERNRGQIINIGSVAGNWPYPGGNAYGASKAFVKQFTNNLRADLSGSAIRVTNIEPGLAETEFSVVRFKGDEERAGEVYQDTRPLDAKDLGEIVFWVADQPPHVNINSMEVMPTCQSWGPFKVHKGLRFE